LVRLSAGQRNTLNLSYSRATPTGAKFNLTNNQGWAEKTVHEHEGGFFGTGGRLEVEIVNPEPTPDATPEAEAEPDPEPGAAPTA
jgi:hypothetical protein